MAFGRYENPRYPLNVGGKICRTKEEEDAQRERMAASTPAPVAVGPSDEDYAALTRQYETRGARVAELDQALGDSQKQCAEYVRQIAVLHVQIAELEAKLAEATEGKDEVLQALADQNAVQPQQNG